jgi:hypothetical protein
LCPAAPGTCHTCYKTPCEACGNSPGCVIALAL